MASLVHRISNEDLLFQELTQHGPATFSAEPMTDEAFVAYCEQHEGFPIETSAEGDIIIMPPAGTISSYQNSDLGRQVANWAYRTKRGRVFDSSAMFVLPNGARRSPDCAYVVNERIAALASNTRRIFWPICPDFVVELRSQTDRRRRLEAKMEEYMGNGAKLGWLIDPQERSVTICRPRRKPETLVEPKVIEGEGPVVGLKVKTRELWWNPGL